MVGLGNVDNTSDVNKPISTLVQTALNNKLDKPVSYSSFYEQSYTTPSTFNVLTLAHNTNMQFCITNGNLSKPPLTTATMLTIDQNGVYANNLTISNISTVTGGTTLKNTYVDGGLNLNSIDLENIIRFYNSGLTSNYNYIFQYC